MEIPSPPTLDKAIRRLGLMHMRYRFASSLRGRRVALVGDSITHGLGDSDRVINLGRHGLKSHELLQMMRPCKEILDRVDVVTLMIGTNDVWEDSHDELEQRIEAIIALVPADKPLIVSAIPPSGHYRQNMRRIDQANGHIRRFVRRRPKTVFIDTWQLFVNEAGAIDYRYFLADMVHLSPAGYRRWTQALQSALHPYG
jgi:lysophospholipase L1-like esterase